jgi:hypothetical protein
MQPTGGWSLRLSHVLGDQELHQAKGKEVKYTMGGMGRRKMTKSGNERYTFSHFPPIMFIPQNLKLFYTIDRLVPILHRFERFCLPQVDPQRLIK